MNERIKDIFDQACFETDYDDVQNLRETMDRFAELIVEECANVADENYIHRGSRTCGLAIRLHFGVEA